MTALIWLALLVPPEADVQGLYEGRQGDRRVEGRLVAMGKSAFTLWLRIGGQRKATLEGRLEGDALALTAEGWKATWSPDALRLEGGNAAIELKRVRRTPPSLGKKPPEGAVVLIDGKNFDEIVRGGNADVPWDVADDGSIPVRPKGLNSKRTFEGSFDLHVEFRCPLQPPARGQGRGNSGCYLPNGDEIQVLDSFGVDTYLGGGCGGLYKYRNPDAFETFSLASLPPLEWQTYDVAYRVPDAGGNPRLTVRHNGILIHDDVELKKKAKPGRFHFQDHGNDVRYRNVWVLIK